MRETSSEWRTWRDTWTESSSTRRITLVSTPNGHTRAGQTGRTITEQRLSLSFKFMVLFVCLFVLCVQVALLCTRLWSTKPPSPSSRRCSRPVPIPIRPIFRSLLWSAHNTPQGSERESRRAQFGCDVFPPCFVPHVSLLLPSFPLILCLRPFSLSSAVKRRRLACTHKRLRFQPNATFYCKAPAHSSLIYFLCSFVVCVMRSRQRCCSCLLASAWTRVWK